MRNLKRITYLIIVFYGLFIFFNIVEIIWNGYNYSLGNRLIISNRMDFMNAFMRFELVAHNVVNVLDIAAQVIFLLLCNWMVKKNNLGKSVHVLLILLSFFPIANLFLYYILWRKLNQNLFKFFGSSYKESDRKIVALWFLILCSVVGSIMFGIAEFYSKSPEFVSTITRLKDLGPLINSCCLLAASVLFLTYFLEFNRGILKKESGVRDLITNDLID